MLRNRRNKEPSSLEGTRDGNSMRSSSRFWYDTSVCPYAMQSYFSCLRMQCRNSAPTHFHLCRRSLVSLAFSQDVTVLLQRASDELRLFPQVGSQEAV